MKKKIIFGVFIWIIQHLPKKDKGGREGMYISFTIGVRTGIILERQRRREGTYTVFLLLGIQGRGKKDHKPAVCLLRDIILCVV
jgi:hypothetical protein